MELRLDINYNQILGLIRQLPKKDIKKLSNTLQNEIDNDMITTKFYWIHQF